ncbi:hypothetical protein MTO96_044015 [Rhipicephalus appendiculatus]
MSKPVPNFLTVQGHRVFCDHQGVTKGCSRCAREGHVGTGLPHPAMCDVRRVRPRHDWLLRPVPPLQRGTRDGRLLTANVVCGDSGGETSRTKAATAEGDTRAEVTAPRDEGEEARAGTSDNPSPVPVKHCSTWTEDSSVGLPAEKESASSTNAESLSGASQVTSTASDITRQSDEFQRKRAAAKPPAPQAQTPCIARPRASSTQVTRWPPGEDTARTRASTQIGGPRLNHRARRRTNKR